MLNNIKNKEFLKSRVFMITNIKTFKVASAYNTSAQTLKDAIHTPIIFIPSTAVAFYKPLSLRKIL